MVPSHLQHFKLTVFLIDKPPCCLGWGSKDEWALRCPSWWFCPHLLAGPPRYAAALVWNTTTHHVCTCTCMHSSVLFCKLVTIMETGLFLNVSYASKILFDKTGCIQCKQQIINLVFYAQSKATKDLDKQQKHNPMRWLLYMLCAKKDSPKRWSQH